MRKPAIICIRSPRSEEIKELLAQLKGKLADMGNNTAVLMQKDAEAVSTHQLKSEYPEADLILIGTHADIELPSIILIDKDLKDAEGDFANMIAIAADGDVQHSDLMIDGAYPDVLDKDDVEGIAAYIIEYAEKNRSVQRFYCKSKLMIAGQNDFFGPGIARLLHMIDETGSIRRAAIDMEMSYSKAWKMVGKIEEETGIQFLDRVNGGKSGGNSILTEKGRAFLAAYDAMVRDMRKYSDRLFDQYLDVFFEDNDK